MIEFEPYHIHTSYSNCLTQPDSTMSIEDYAKVYRERGHHVLCMSEHGNRSNVWQQFDLAKKYSDDTFKMTPLAAAETYFVPDRTVKEHRGYHLILVAKNMDGFYELNEALSEANLTGFYYHARVDFDILSRLNYRNFLCTSACVAGPDDEQMLIQLRNIFRENFYLEVQHHPQQIQKDRNKWMLELSKKHKWPLIYGTDSHYIFKEEKELRRELLLSARITYGNEDEFLLYLPTAEEAYTMLKEQGVLSRAQIEEAMENTLILREFEGVSFDRERKFPISRPELTQAQRNSLYKHMVCDGYIAQAGMPNKEEAAEIHKEMDTIVETNSADYFIGLHDMLELGKKKGGILTTTSRGSACGFASNYALGFTSINRLHVPVRMYPARFISKAKLLSGSMPDIDSNISNLPAFEEAGKEIFGEWGCLPMIAYGTAKTLSAFKMLARARDTAAQEWAVTDEKASALKKKIDEEEKKLAQTYGNNANYDLIKKEPYYQEYERLLEEHGALPFEKANEISKQIQDYEMDLKHAKENNEDDPDYDPSDDVRIESYIDEKYLDLIEESKKYKGIITSISCHPCAHLVYHKDLRREIGVIRVKSKSGNKEPIMAAYIDGTFGDKYGYCKSDLLRVDVVKVIYDTFKLAGQEVMTADELIEKTKDDKDVWNVLADGYTMGCNQTERPKTTERIKIFKPKNTVELSAFIAAIRPGAKSLVDYLVTRTPFTYGIPSMDKLLRLDGATGVTGESSFLLFDEQIMVLAEAAGISPEDTNALIKHIKKKHHDDVAKYKEAFIPGFEKYLTETEHAAKEKAEETADMVWTTIINSASYLFNLSHAYAMCLDCLYGMYLKCYYPYEFYITLLKLYDEKKKTDKISAIISEMKRYKNIQLSAGRFGQDNRDWLVDKENHTISQSLSSIKHISKKAANDLYKSGQKQYDSFTEVLRELQMNTGVDTRQIQILIQLNYFEQFGKSEKLMKVFNEFFEGKNKLTKTVKSFADRLKAVKCYEEGLPNTALPINVRLKAEQDNIGLCLTADKNTKSSLYFVKSIDDKYGVKASMYSVQRGTSGIVRFRKDAYAKHPFEEGDCIDLTNFNKSPRFTYKNGTRAAVPGEYEIWAKEYKVFKAPNSN